jgi:beta-galactosidase
VTALRGALLAALRRAALAISVAGGLAHPAAAAPAADVLDLSGSWRFALDREDQGVAGRWYEHLLDGTIQLPGILNAQGYGDEIGVDTPWVLSLYDKNWFLREDYRAYAAPGRVKVPFLSQPPRHYLGAAWYQREVEVPRAWRGKRVVLQLERPRWGSTTWVDGREAGTNRSLVAEHDVDLGMLASGKHRISVRVDSRLLMNYRPDAHSVSDSLGMSWNGIVGKIALRATAPVYIDDAQLYPRVGDRSVLVRLRIGNTLGRAGSGVVTANGKRIPPPGASRAARSNSACSTRAAPRPGTNGIRCCRSCVSSSAPWTAAPGWPTMRASCPSASSRSAPAAPTSWSTAGPCSCAAPTMAAIFP